jgi:outer membrane protein assembly factor BamB
MTGPGRRSAVAGCSLLLAAGLAVGGCGGSTSSSGTASACPAKTGKAVTASNPVAPSGKPAPGWTRPGADLANTRDVASAITSANVSKLGVAWTVPLHTSLSHTDGAYATTPVIVNGVVYVQDLQSNVMAAVNDLALPASPTGYTAGVAADLTAVEKAAGEMVAVNQDTGAVEWDTPIPSSPYGAATVTNDLVFTTTFHGDLVALNAGTGQILLKTPMSAGSNAPVAVDGDYVIAGAGASLVPSQQRMIIAYKLGATGKLPDTVGS